MKDKQQQNNSERPGELARDKQREDHRSYGGQNWNAAEKRGENERFGQARNDDANPLELQRVDKDVKDADETVESGGQRAGMGRGEAPRKPKERMGNKNG